jgi:hypothetical protein
MAESNEHEVGDVRAEGFAGDHFHLSRGIRMKMSAVARRIPKPTTRILGCYLLIPSLLALLTILRGTVYAPSLPFFDRVLLFLPSALSGWIVAGVFIAGLIESTKARSIPATAALTAAGAILAATVNYYVLGSYYFSMLDRWPWLTPFYSGNVPLFKDPLRVFLVGPSAIYFYATIAIAYTGYRVLVPGARYLGDRGNSTTRATPAMNSVRKKPRSAGDDKSHFESHSPGKAQSPVAAVHPGAPAFMRRLAPQLGGELILLSAEEHYVRIVTRLGSALVLCRLGDAIEELTGLDGDRVHRSFWIAWREVAKIQRQGRTFRLKMSSGEYVPVSRSHIGVVSRRLSQYTAAGRVGPMSAVPIERQAAPLSRI